MQARDKKRVELFMEDMSPMEKTLVFCSTQEHAASIRNMINQKNCVTLIIVSE